MNPTPEDLVCAPLDTFEEIFEFLHNPPAWRTLCQELKPGSHSMNAIRNMDLCRNPESITLENPVTFCHYDPNEPDLPRHDKKSLPKTLVCHDMANGYHDDAYIQGTSKFDAYTFWNWGVVDIFCYFSHHLVTIPPVSWINVAHAHGAKVIGTIITEWSPGSMFWDRVLASPDTINETAVALTAIAKALKFDGWLLNVENKIAEPLKLLEFVKTLHWLLHEALPCAELIWYDSVTIEGDLAWQNQLNEYNRPFFEACDGLFTNYSWREEEVIKSAVAAGDRRTDIYVGIDVWGRNFFGGGQLNTQQAMKVVWRHRCSVALFAPAWTHEAIPKEPGYDASLNSNEDMGVREGLLEQFMLREAALWGSLWPFLHTRLPARLPFATTFCRGQGRRRFFYGEVVSPGPWYNLRHMQYQPNSAHGPHVYLVSTLNNLRALHLTPSTHDVPAAGDSLASPESARLIRVPTRDTYTSTVEKRNVGTNRSIPMMDIATNSIEKCNVGTDRPPKRKVSFHLHDGRYEPGTEDQAVQFDNTPEPERRSVGSDADHPPEGPQETGDEVVQEDEGPGNTKSKGAPVIGGSYTVRQESRRDAGALQVATAGEERWCVSWWWGDAFCGGASLVLHSGDTAGPRHRTARLLHCELRCGHALAVCVVTKRAPTAPTQQLDLLLHAKTDRGHPLRFVLLDDPLPGRDETTENKRVYEVLSALGDKWEACKPLGSGPDFESFRRHLLIKEPGFYIPRDNAFGWNVRYYWLQIGDGIVKSIGARCRERLGPALLGHLALCHGPARLRPEMRGPDPSILLA